MWALGRSLRRDDLIWGFWLLGFMGFQRSRPEGKVASEVGYYVGFRAAAVDSG